MARVLIAFGCAVVLAAAGVFYAMRAAPAPSVAVEPGPVDLSEPGRLVFRDEVSGRVASVSLLDPGGARRLSSLSCQRFYVAAGTGLCLATASGPLPSAVAVSVDSSLTERSRVEVAGVPNRVKLSADGRMASWTTFVTGDSYTAPGSFSTRTAIRDLRDDQLSSNIEDLRVEGVSQSPDTNIWGVTFSADDKTFFATVGAGGRTYLVRASYDTWEATVLRENAECPSLSPDGRRVAFKKRVASDGARPWRAYVLDLATMTETALAETRGVDDQMVWLDDSTIAYGLPGEGIWAVRADGSGAPRLLVPHASSPSVTGVTVSPSDYDDRPEPAG
ncbi:TolB-like translocation protein; signal peptide [Lentzea sp. NBRC 105346]|uniref:hypothetical protein n=1 Tax=Lentzea sp. NBRC 105346 TaxID=3032205 RepID=UPI0024A0442E|nr:hypothetical protein [Lentzea sp. NBRC 105346]GLZ28634.1 TolB-like translocation protein; signal peptide [Lentzea sp. NBRC 105346]